MTKRVLSMFHTVPRVYVITLSCAFLLAWTPLAFIAPLLLILVLSRLLSWKWGFWTSVAAAFLVLSAFFACLAGAAWLIKAPLIAPVITDITAVALAITASFFRHGSIPRLQPSRHEFIIFDDLLALVAGVIAASIVCLPLIPRPSVENVAPFIMYGGDNSAHLRMVEVIDQNQGYSIGQHNRVNLNGILVAYPQGWHFVTAYAQSTINQTLSVKAHPSLILILFYGICAVWWGVLVFLMARLALLAIAAPTRPGLTTFLAKAMTATASLLGALCLLLSLLTYGFQTQVAALAFLLLEILCLIAACSAAKHPTQYVYVWLAGLILAGSGFSWLFLYPISGVLLLIVAIYIFSKTRTMPAAFIAGSIPTVGFIMFQPLVQLLVKVPAYQDGVNILNQRGNVAETNLAWITIGVVGVLIFAYIKWRHWVLRLLLVGTVTGLIFSLGLLWYQLGTIHELRYYYYKSTYTVITFLLIAFSAAIGYAAVYLMEVDGPLRRWRYAQFSLVAIAFTVLTVTIMPLTSPRELNGMLGKNLVGISPSQATSIAGIVQAQPENAWRVISIGSCNRGDDIRATLLANALSTVPKGPHVLIPASIPLENIDKAMLFAEISKFIQQDSKNALSMIILSNDQVVGSELLASLTPEARQKIQLVNLDTTLETEPLSQCPERVHYLTESANQSAGR